MLKHYPLNTAGRDFAVGDIHGHFSRLQAALDSIGFDPAVDRLFSVGDLVDRGPESRLALDWLSKPWFHPVRGNHDHYVCEFITCNYDEWLHNGGVWFVGLALDEKREFSAQFNEIPFAIEVETDAGLVGLVHADCPFPSWGTFQFELTAQHHNDIDSVLETCMWSRRRIKSEDKSGVLDVRAVVCGHTPLHKAAVLGNVYHIDTGGWHPSGEGYFTFLNLQTLEAIPALKKPLDFAC